MLALATFAASANGQATPRFKATGTVITSGHNIEVGAQSAVRSMLCTLAEIQL